MINQIEKEVVWVIMGQEYAGTVIPFYENDYVYTVQEVANIINSGLEYGYNTINLFKDDIELDKVYSVIQFNIENQIIINEHNAPLSEVKISKESIEELRVTKEDILKSITRSKNEEENNDRYLKELHNRVLTIVEKSKSKNKLITKMKLLKREWLLLFSIKRSQNCHNKTQNTPVQIYTSLIQ